MRLLKLLICSSALLIAFSASAEPSYDKIFAGVEPCFTLYDLNKGKTVESYNSNRCKEQISPCSTFKIPLSLMGFDSGILKDEDTPKWEFKPEYPAVIESHAKDQTPKSWLSNSVVWYSQILTKKLGMEKFKEYVSKFDYGNQDVSGNLGKDDGLTRSWLDSSLKISANEQIEFLKKLITYKLPISKESINHTKNNMFIEEFAGGWKLYGKTGSATHKNPDGSDKNAKTGFGWFVGILEKEDQTYIFALNINDKQKATEYAGPRAKAIAKEIFSNLDILK
ncbi:MAG: class D beta-lactamase [Alphaproteobacteria bacterium]